MEVPIGLPQLAPKDQVRSGLSLELEIDAQRLRLLNVHLKSSCVSPVEAGSDLAPSTHWAQKERPAGVNQADRSGLTATWRGS